MVDYYRPNRAMIYVGPGLEADTGTNLDGLYVAAYDYKDLCKKMDQLRMELGIRTAEKKILIQEVEKNAVLTHKLWSVLVGLLVILLLMNVVMRLQVHRRTAATILFVQHSPVVLTSTWMAQNVDVLETTAL